MYWHTAGLVWAWPKSTRTRTVPTSLPSFQVDSPSTISNGALQVTPDSASADFNLFNNSGRVLLLRRFKLWHDATAPAASFNTLDLLSIINLFLSYLIPKKI
ncbi:lectin-like protein kinase [Striga asiatica]|uniref:Lectin-like protein kinase n=1 Tax=Striga asiatica TaxID=4170 RepID=A0A5A7QWX5_STRAF|nr:lectin-like protein kinase [Striga asiatica]